MALRFVVAALVLAVWCDAAQSSGSRSRRKRQAAAREVRERKYQKKEQDLNTPLASAKSVTAAKSATAAAAAKVGTAGYTAKQLAAGGFSSKQLRKIARKELMEEQAREEHKEWMRYESRAIRSSNQQRFSLIPDKWGGNLDCDRPLRALDSQDSDELVVAIASDELDPLPIFAAINSTVSNYNFARDPDGVLPFAIFVAETTKATMVALVRRYITPRWGSRAYISVCTGLDEHLQRRAAMRSLLKLTNSTRVKRRELLTSFNFAAFYLPYILSGARRVLYLDSDVIVRGDVGELARMDMQGKPAAAVEDCTQRIGRYIDFPLAAAYRQAAVARIAEQNANTSYCSAQRYGEAAQHPPPTGIECEPEPWPLPSNETCVFNRGVLLLNREVWVEMRMAERIERHTRDFTHSRGALFRAGVSQPPFLLELANHYVRLNGEWNVRGLGRDTIGRAEWSDIAAEAGRSYAAIPALLVELEMHMSNVAQLRRASHARQRHEVADVALPSGRNPYDGKHFPFVSPYAAHAKILHFNGGVKPWHMSRRTVEHTMPAKGALCLWRDVSFSNRSAKQRAGTFDVVRKLHRNALPSVACDKPRLSDCVSSCTTDWVRYVEGLDHSYFGHSALK